jgi:hypothetical protein
MVEDFLKEDKRAEDIILGSLGFGGEATIISIRGTENGFSGLVRWAEGDESSFESDDELSELERWALRVLLSRAG